MVRQGELGTLTTPQVCEAIGISQFDHRALVGSGSLGPAPGRGGVGCFTPIDVVAIAYGSAYKRAGIHLAAVAQVVKRIRALPADELAKAIEGRTIVVPTPTGPALVLHLTDEQQAPTGMLLRTVHRSTMRRISSLRGGERRGRLRDSAGSASLVSRVS